MPDALAEIERVIQIESRTDWLDFVCVCAIRHFEIIAYEAGRCRIEILNLGTRGTIWGLTPVHREQAAMPVPPDGLAAAGIL